jgi:hypothetical protein
MPDDDPLIGEQGAEDDRETVDAAVGSEESADDSDLEELRQVMAELRLRPEQIAGRLKAAKDWERKAKHANAQSKGVDQQLADLREQLAERDAVDIERAGRLAMAQVRSGLATEGVKVEDVAAVLDLVDPASTLLKNGDPDDAAIAKLVASLSKVSGQVRPDPDQGKRSGQAPVSMNDLIRRARGITI